MEKKIVNVYPLTPMQEGILYHSIVDNCNQTYMQQVIFDGEGDLDVALLEECFQLLIQKYDVLRTIFIYKNTKTFLQAVINEVKISVKREDITGLSDSEKIIFTERYIEGDRNRVIDLSRETSLSATVLRYDDCHFKVIISFHHIIMDGWSFGIVLKDLLCFYRNKRKLLPVHPEPIVPFGSYVRWLMDQDKESVMQYWNSYLKKYAGLAILPKKSASVAAGKYRQRDHEFHIETALEQKLFTLAAEKEVTLNTIFLAVWGIVLQKYNDTEDVVFGYVNSVRPSEIHHIESMAGIFINTIPIRVKCGDRESFGEMLVQIGASELRSRQNSFCSLADIQNQTEQKSNLINHIMIFQNFPIHEEVNSSQFSDLGFQVRNYVFRDQTNYDMNVIIGMSDGLSIKFSYNENSFSEEIINQLEQHMVSVLNQITYQPEKRIGEIDLLTDLDRHKIAFEWNDTICSYEKEQMIHRIFERQASKTPDRIAVTFREEHITYHDLNEKADLLAKKIRRLNPTAKIAGIMTERSIQMVIGILAILKVGCAYVPIDRELPEERIKYLLEDCDASILLCRPEENWEIPFKGMVIDLCVEASEDLESEMSCGGSAGKESSEDLAYIIYTSGSTGKPKGVMVSHYSVINRINWMQKKFRLTGEDKILQKTTYTFDVSVWELFWWFFSGSTLCLLPPKAERDPQTIFEHIKNEKITVIHFVPSLLRAYLSYISSASMEDGHSTLRYVFSSGEALDSTVVQDFYRIMKKITLQLVNLYGPTEATVDVSYFECDRGVDYSSIPIGRPIDNTSLYVLNKHNRIQPFFVPGELGISGDGLAKGYCNNIQLTRERFIENPYKQGSLLYKTGDLARLLPDGNIEYLGRIDHQVKLNGFRIELGEIEYYIRNYHGIQDVAVTLTDAKNGKFLAAYMVSDQQVDLQQLVRYLEENVPYYMVPKQFAFVDQMPLTPSGKLDKAKLPDMRAAHSAGDRATVDVSQLEHTLIQIWKELLGKEGIHSESNFFDEGGQSILAINLDAVLIQNKIVDESFEIFSHIYSYPTIRELAHYIESSGAAHEE